MSNQDQKITPSLNLTFIFQAAAWAILFAAAVYLIVSLVGLNTIREVVEEAGAFGPLVFVALKAATIVFAPVGGNPFYFIASSLFDFTKGFLYLFVGDLLGHVVAFAIARLFGRALMSKVLPTRALAIVEALLGRLSTWQGLLAARLWFLTLGDFISYAAGLGAISFPQYLAVSLPLLVLNAIIMMTVGHLLVSNTVVLVLAVVALAGAGVGVVVTRHRKS